MTNDKKNIKSLVSDADDDPTAELEIIRADGLAQLPDGELESEANTFDCDEVESSDDEVDVRILRLRKEVRSRDESIGRMQFDIEQLRARWNGLDKEIQVREQLTDKLNIELRTTKSALASTERELSRSKDELRERERQLRKLESSATDDKAKVELLESRLHELEKQARLDEEAKAEAEKAAASAKSVELETQLAERSEKISELAAQLENRDLQIAALSDELDVMRRELDDTQANLVQLKQADGPTRHGANDNSHEFDVNTTQRRAGEEGLIVDSRQEVRDLQAQLRRTEAYADTLRNRLQDSTKLAQSTSSSLEQTELALTGAEQQISELNELLEAERLETASLKERIEGLSKEFDDEVRKIRFELGSAQQTITDHETVNEQLTSDLIDNQNFRQALESKLEQTEVSADSKIRELRKKIKSLERQHSEDAFKISNKDNAIAALLNELASRSSTAEDFDNIDDSRLQETEVGAFEKQDDRIAADRITRLLIGNIDGQELRFPLFKDRLTIGRTTQNDIHLKAQYISRRHALIVTENEHTRIVDWGSKNGISVNGKKVTEQVLKSGDIVTIGTADFRYEERPKR